MIDDGRSRRIIVAVALGIALAGALGGPIRAEEPSLSASFRRATSRARVALVSIRAADGFVPLTPMIGAPAPFSPNLPIRPMVGLPMPVYRTFSGLIVEPDKGWILTAELPTQGASRFVVTFPDGRERATAEIRRDPRSGLALLAADMRDLPHPRPTWGDPSRLEPGDWLVALGQPGPGDPSMSVGVFGARRRAAGGDRLETDAAIGRIGGGGVLINLDGEVVGICQPSRQRPDGSEMMGHAVPSDRARRIAEDLGRFGLVRRAYLGVGVEPTDPAAPRLSLRVISIRPESPAAEAHLDVGDVILSANGRALDGVTSLQDEVEATPIGNELTLSLDRRGHRIEVKVRMRALPGTVGPVISAQPDAASAPERAPDTARP